MRDGWLEVQERQDRYLLHEDTGFCVTRVEMGPHWRERGVMWLVWKPGQAWKDGRTFKSQEEACNYVEGL